jgi:hypothetical protein
MGIWDLDAEDAPHDGLAGFVRIELIRELGEAGSPQLVFGWQDGSLPPDFGVGSQFSIGIGATF